MRKGANAEGYGLLELLVALALFVFCLMFLSIGVQNLLLGRLFLQESVGALSAFTEAEDFLRKEIGALQFVPYCPSMLPSYREMHVGHGVSEKYRDYLQHSVIVSLPRLGSDQAVINLWALSGSGSGTYNPPLEKTVSGISRGSSVFQVRGLLPVDLKLQGSLLVGDLTSDLVGVRDLVFYLTDCRSSMVLRAERNGDFFRMSKEDGFVVHDLFDQKRLHVYVVKEYLIYVKVEKSKSNLVVDFLDGQAFLRIPNFVDLRVELLKGGVLSIGLLLASPSINEVSELFFQAEGYGRILKNFNELEYRKVLIRLGND